MALTAVELLLSSAWLAIIAWLILRAFKQRGLLPRLLRASPPRADDAPAVAIVVPARDEEANIGACLQSLLAQDYPASRLSVHVVDDNSIDATVPIVRGFAARYPHVSLLKTPPLPPRWIGKSHACWIGARGVDGGADWLCFIDADVTLEPGALSSAMHAALREDIDLLSLAPRQQLDSFAERLILPCGLILMAFLQDLRQVQARSGTEVTATGQFMLVRREAYDAVGGHAAVSSAICEDIEFARRLKRSGHSVLLMGGERLLSTRMYTGWRTLWPGLAKNLVDMLGGPAATLLLVLVGVTLGWAALAVPAIDLLGAVAGSDSAWLALGLALIASGAAFGLHVAATVYFRIPFWYGLLFPLGYSAGALMALDSVRRRISGRVVWKGRIYS